MATSPALSFWTWAGPPSLKFGRMQNLAQMEKRALGLARGGHGFVGNGPVLGREAVLYVFVKTRAFGPARALASGMGWWKD